MKREKNRESEPLKTSVEVPVGEPEPSTPGVYLVNSPEQDVSAIVQAAQQNKEIRWPILEYFFELPEEVIRSMNHRSRLNYTMAKTAKEQERKDSEKGYTGRLEVIELYPNNSQTRFEMDAPPDVHVFYPTLEMAKSAEYAGYKYVSASDSRFKQRVPSMPASDMNSPERLKALGLEKDKVYVYNTVTGRPEHVAMYIPKERYEKHIESISKISQANIKRSDDDLNIAKREAAARARKSGDSYMDIEAVSEVRYDKEELTQVYDPSLKKQP